jgi:arabinofuranosyltransferase
VLWGVFSLTYYGFPFPNTAYSKLNAAISTGQFMSQGAWYLVECASRDPLTALVILLGIVAPLLTRNRLLLPHALGVLLYLLYVVRVGGDFMAGRFLTAPFLLALLVLFHGVVPALPGPLTRLAAAVVLFVPLTTRSSPLEESGPPDCVISESGISDERDCYRAHTALSENMRKNKYKKHDYWQRGVEYRKTGGVHAENVVGLTSFAAGPDVHLVDLFGLTDPLLARTPYEPPGSDWRIGHFYRKLPDGYVESLESGENRIKDRCLADYYDRLKLVTRGPIWSWDRFKAIYSLNVRERTVMPCPRGPNAPG